METQDKEISILEILKTNPDLGQRDLAKAIGASLGMTNSLLKRLAEKGWVTVCRISPRNLSYVLTPSGVKEFSQRSFGYLKRTIKSVRDFKAQIQKYCDGIKTQGFLGVSLLGESDFDFIIEHAVLKAGMRFSCVSKIEDAPSGDFILHGESELMQEFNPKEILE